MRHNFSNTVLSRPISNVFTPPAIEDNLPGCQSDTACLFYRTIARRSTIEHTFIDKAKDNEMNPFLLGYLVVAIVFGLGYFIERWSWSKPIAVLCFLALTIDSLIDLAKMLFRM